MHYLPDLSLTILGFVLVAIAGSGMTLTLETYDKKDPKTGAKTEGKTEKPDVPLLTEDQILTGLNGKSSLEPTTVPEIIPPKNAIVPVKDQVKQVMQNKIVEALQKARVTVEINGTMDMDGEFKDPEITFGITNAPNPTSDKPVVKTEKPENEKLKGPRV